MNKPATRKRNPDAKRRDPAAIRQWNRGHAARLSENGRPMVTARLSAAGYRELRAICDRHQCSVRDAIEGLLFGNLPAPNPLRLSPAEADAARALGVAL